MTTTRLSTNTRKDNMQKPKNYHSITTRYIDAVTNGEIDAPEWIQTLCHSHRNALARKKSAYKFDTKQAGRACAAMEQLLSTTLEPAESFILSLMFGWIDSATGTRRAFNDPASEQLENEDESE